MPDFRYETVGEMLVSDFGLCKQLELGRRSYSPSTQGPPALSAGARPRSFTAKPGSMATVRLAALQQGPQSHGAQRGRHNRSTSEEPRVVVAEQVGWIDLVPECSSWDRVAAD